MEYLTIACKAIRHYFLSNALSAQPGFACLQIISWSKVRILASPPISKFMALWHRGRGMHSPSVHDMAGSAWTAHSMERPPHT